MLGFIIRKNNHDHIHFCSRSRAFIKINKSSSLKKSQNEPRCDNHPYNHHHDKHVGDDPEHWISENCSRIIETCWARKHNFIIAMRRKFHVFFLTPSKILGAVAVFLVGWDFATYFHYLSTPLVFFLIVASACLIGTFCLLVSCLISLSTGGIFKFLSAVLTSFEWWIIKYIFIFMLVMSS